MVDERDKRAGNPAGPVRPGTAASPGPFPLATAANVFVMPLMTGRTLHRQRVNRQAPASRLDGLYPALSWPGLSRVGSRRGDDV